MISTITFCQHTLGTTHYAVQIMESVKMIIIASSGTSVSSYNLAHGKLRESEKIIGCKSSIIPLENERNSR